MLGQLSDTVRKALAGEGAGGPAAPAADGRGGRGGGHVFISHVREDSRSVDRLQAMLEAAGVRVWRDTADLWPGEDWRAKIRHAITGDAR
jgi:hypothetical protein